MLLKILVYLVLIVFPEDLLTNNAIWDVFRVSIARLLIRNIEKAGQVE